MRLVTKNGPLDLPSDFKMDMERYNPLLSDEGDACIPITLPSSSRNLAALGHRERIDLASAYTNKEEAYMQVGPVQKHGNLVIDSVHRRNGIDVSFAIDSGDLYVQSKDKSLKQLFAKKTLAFGSVENACTFMQEVYRGEQPDADFVVFPVAVSPYEEGEGETERTVYQYNNEDSGGGKLVYERRIVHEGDASIFVPDGYGIAPYLKLQRLLSLLFQELHYTVEYNCFDEAPFRSQIAIVHNCADCLVTPVLYYADLVPSCTLGEFLEWLLAKFHVQPVVDSEKKRVRIVRMESILENLYGPATSGLDISGMVEGDWEICHNPSKRVVLRPTVEIEGTEPAAETLDALLEKYGGYAVCSETQFDTLLGDDPAFSDCLVMRGSTGEFFLLERNVSSQVLHRLGTNYFTYDRGNSEETEEFAQADVMPRMIVGDKARRDVAPFIGERIHRHTSYGDVEDDNEQKIIAVQAHTSDLFHYPTTGTTQKTIPNSSNGSYSFWFGMDNYSLFQQFWYVYNTILLNGAVHLKGRVKYTAVQFLGMDMTALQLCDGQKLLPVKMSAPLGGRMGLAEAEFILVKWFVGGITDTAYTPMASAPLRWQLNLGELQPVAMDIYWHHIYIEGRVLWRGFRARTSDGIWLGVPTYLGEKRELTTEIVFTILTEEKVTEGPIDTWHDREHRIDGCYEADGTPHSITGTPWNWLKQNATVKFEAVAV